MLILNQAVKPSLIFKTNNRRSNAGVLLRLIFLKNQMKRIGTYVRIHSLLFMMWVRGEENLILATNSKV